jgi:hypothetical protein
MEHQRTQSEMGAVLSAFFSDRVLPDIGDANSKGDIQIVVLRDPRLSGIWKGRRFWRLEWFDRRPSFPKASLVTRGSFLLSNVVPTEFPAGVHAPKGVDYVVVSRRELESGQPGDFERRFPNKFAYVAVSQPGLNFSKTEAIFYIDYYCGGLCGSGGYVLMRKVGGVWQVVDEHIVWVS